MKSDFENFLCGSAAGVAPLLLGSQIVRDFDGRRLVGKIVETEAYDQSDAASHSYRGRTPRTEIMFGSPGRAYIYFTYGMHYCLNIVTGRKGYGCAVLIRALEPIEGLHIMRINRGRTDQLTNGPAKLCQALGINSALNGHNLRIPPLVLRLGTQSPGEEIVQTTRVGISKAVDKPWRFYIKNNPFVSKL
jgi:DNA-3-methyladenine glycosylase